MKTCPNCHSITFDDMEMCFDCMSPLANVISNQSEDEEAAISAARLRVTLAGYFCYELLLHKLEGRSLSVGSGAENAIVIPQEHVAQHQLEVFYAHGQMWAESVNASAQATIGEIPLCGTVRIQSGTEICIGDARITVLDE